jgi:hypothetical protein
MPRLFTVVSVATILLIVVAFNLIPSFRYTTSIQDQYKVIQGIYYVHVPEVVPSTIGNTTTTTTTTAIHSSSLLSSFPKLLPPDALLTMTDTTVKYPSTFNTATTPTDTDPTQNAGGITTNMTATFLSSFLPSTTPLMTTTATNLSHFLKETKQHLIDSATTTAWSNVSTYSFGPRHLISGYRNQIMSLAMLMMKANDEGHEQFLLDTLRHKDTYGTNKFVPFEVFFDVAHWNSFYNASEYKRTNQTHNVRDHPISLPRLVYYDQNLHHQWDNTTNSFVEAVRNGSQTPTHPYGYLLPSTRLQMTYQRYAKGKTKYIQQQQQQQQKEQQQQQNIKWQHMNRSDEFGQSKRNPAEILMLQGALKPHPTLQGILESLLEQIKPRVNTMAPLLNSSTNINTIDWSYMTLHARVEPDMQRHPVCKDKKVLYLRTIIQMIETKFLHPPVSIVFMPINRQYLEKEGILPVNDNPSSSSSSSDNHHNNSINWVAVDNLRELNRIRQDGMWNGTVPVVEFGANALKGTVYEHCPSTAGAILNFFLTLQPQCSIFIGTPVSSFSHDVLASRFYRGYRHYHHHHHHHQQQQQQQQQQDQGNTKTTSIYQKVW